MDARGPPPQGYGRRAVVRATRLRDLAEADGFIFGGCYLPEALQNGVK
jgi:hypothetical protein